MLMSQHMLLQSSTQDTLFNFFFTVKIMKFFQYT